jgi:hypothetical protein
MMTAFAGVDVPEEFLALVSRDALQSDTTGATPVQVTIFDAVSRGLAHHSLSLRFLLGKLAADEEGLELKDPINSLLPCQCQENAVAEDSTQSRTPCFGGGSKAGESSDPIDGGEADGLKRRSSKTPAGCNISEVILFCKSLL